MNIQIDLPIEEQLELCQAANRILDNEVNQCLDGMQSLITKIDECLDETTPHDIAGNSGISRGCAI